MVRFRHAFYLSAALSLIGCSAAEQNSFLFDGENPAGIAALNLRDLAIKLGEASSAAYDAPGTLRQRFATILPNSHVQIIEQGDVRAVVATDARDVIIAFRGTDSGSTWSNLLSNITRDASIVRTTVPGVSSSATFHSGFAGGVQSVFGALEAEFRDRGGINKTLWFTGHSLGGAMSQIAALRFRYLTIGGVATYGAPAVGNAAAASAVSNLGFVYRFFHTQDPVPRVPFSALGYARASSELNVETLRRESPTLFTELVHATAQLACGNSAFSAHSMDNSYLATLRGANLKGDGEPDATEPVSTSPQCSVVNEQQGGSEPLVASNDAPQSAVPQQEISQQQIPVKPTAELVSLDKPVGE